MRWVPQSPGSASAGPGFLFCVPGAPGAAAGPARSPLVPWGLAGGRRRSGGARAVPGGRRRAPTMATADPGGVTAWGRSGGPGAGARGARGAFLVYFKCKTCTVSARFALKINPRFVFAPIRAGGAAAGRAQNKRARAGGGRGSHYWVAEALWVAPELSLEVGRGSSNGGRLEYLGRPREIGSSCSFSLCLQNFALGGGRGGSFIMLIALGSKRADDRARRSDIQNEMDFWSWRAAHRPARAFCFSFNFCGPNVYRFGLFHYCLPTWSRTTLKAVRAASRSRRAAAAAAHIDFWASRRRRSASALALWVDFNSRWIWRICSTTVRALFKRFIASKILFIFSPVLQNPPRGAGAGVSSKIFPRVS